MAVVALGAAGLLAFGAVGAASAATGDTNFGVRDIVVTPTAPAVNFATPGTTGTISWNSGDGTAPGIVTYAAGDTSVSVYSLPVGLVFDNYVCPELTGAGTVDCVISDGGRTVTTTITITLDGFQDPNDYNDVIVSFPVISTGEPIVGAPSVSITVAPGLSSEATSAVGVVVGEEPPAGPLVLGGFLAAAGLGAGAFVVSRRRKATA